MKSIIQNFLLLVVTISSISAFGQGTNQENIKAKWGLDKFEFLKKVPDAQKLQSELKMYLLNFGSDTLIISRMIKGNEQFYKSGPYHLSNDGLGLFIGDDRADIVSLNNEQLVVKVRDQYVMYLKKSDCNDSGQTAQIKQP